MRTLAIINQKGGCGKTTTAINLAASFAKAGRSTLLVDMDPQGHCALGLAVPEKQIATHIGSALTAGFQQQPDLSDLIWQVSSGLDLIPSTVALAGAERQLANASDKDMRLKQLLDRVGDDYEICLIDCPPSIGLLTFNALRAANEVIIPVETGYFALKGAMKQASTLRVIAQRANHHTHLHVLPTMYDVRTRQAREIMGDLKKHFGPLVLPVCIHFNAKLKEAASFGQPITEYDPSSRGATDYQQLAAHLLAHPVKATADPPAPAQGYTVIESPDQPLADRAADLVRRARALQQKTNEMQRKLETDPQLAQARAAAEPSEPSAPTTEQARRKLQQRISKLYGVRLTDQGALFCQPVDHFREVKIAGDFNAWKPESAMMKRNEQLSVWELLLPLPPGKYRYRLVVDGKWTSDPHNQQVETNPYGELNSVIEVN